MQNTDDGVARSAASLPARSGALILLALTFTAAQASAQQPAWTGGWGITLQTRYDDNPLRLNDWEKANLHAGLPQFQGIDRANDVLHTFRVQGVLRGPGMGGRPARIGIDIPVAAYTFSRRRLQVSVAGSASQKLSTRDEIDASVSFTPWEFQRNYLIGVDDGGSPLYAEGSGRRLHGSIGYTREIVHGRGDAPDLDAELSVHGSRRFYSEFPWRNRNEFGPRIALALETFGRLETEVSASRSQTYHAQLAEPVSDSAGVTMMATRRDYVELQLEAEAAIRLLAENRLVVGYERRSRDYLATLAEDIVYGDRRDHRDAYRTELRFRLSPSMSLTFGGSIEDQSRFRPGRGDTGDEADYRRNMLFLSLRLLR